MSGYPECQAMF